MWVETSFKFPFPINMFRAISLSMIDFRINSHLQLPTTYTFKLTHLDIAYAFLGFVGAITDADSLDAITLIQFQGVAKLTFRYVAFKEEWAESFIFARIDAFSSLDCLGKSSDSAPLGTPAIGATHGSESYNRSAQMVGRHSVGEIET